MSSRQLRKLQQQRELEAQAKLAEQEEEDESEDEPVVPSNNKASIFANLAALEDEAEDQDDEQNSDSVEQAHAEPIKELSTTTPAPKKSKKSKKKKKVKSTAKELSVEEHANDSDDIDAALKELALKKSAGGTAVSSAPKVDPEYERVCRLLGIQTQNLKVANEMRNLFGREVLENHDDAGGRVRGNRRQRQMPRQVDLETALKGHHLPGKGLSEVTLRRNNFIQGKEDWPKGTTGGLKMEVVDNKTEDGTVEFRFVHDKMYQDLQKTFRGYVEIGDPQNLIGLLTRNPYHISLLIQVSKIAKDQSDHALASDLIERALFSFGRACLSQFNTKLSMGKARLDFARPENRELWLAGYHYIKALMMKGTYRTAFEWAKLLLSLDPEGDPYCMRLMIHHLALRAHEFNWLLDVSESKIPELWTPNGNKTNLAASHTTPSLAFAALQLKEGAEMRKLLTESMMKVPWLFTRLFKELSLDAPPSIWGIQARTEAEELFTELYVIQTKDLWNTPEATSLLMEVGHTIKSIDVKAIPKVANEEMTLDVVRFVYLDNTPALMAMVPSKLLHRENNSDSDPLPPESNTYSYEAQRLWVEPVPRGGPSALGGDFLDPIAALARVIPGLRNLIGQTDDSNVEERMRRGLEDIVNDESEDDGEGDDGADPSIPRSVAQSLLNMLGWAGPEAISTSDDDDDDDEDEFVDAEEGTDTDYEDMPDLVPLQQ